MKACLLALLLLSAAGCRSKSSSMVGPRVIVLGIDGMDPGLLARRMSESKMKNFSRLAAMGGFKPLGTSIPPQSPVAWSSFITGLDPGGHDIFDFLRHDHRTFAIAESTSFHKEPLRIFGLPLWGGGMVNLRKGKAFWEYLEDAGIEATVFRIPANFPPVGRRARTVSGMGTPDLRGTNGTFTYFTNSPPLDAKEFAGGTVAPVEVSGNVVRAHLGGPPAEDGSVVEVPLTVYLDGDQPVARLDVCGERRILLPGEWSDWVHVEFPLLPGMSARGIVRFHLKKIRPIFQLYASPVNLDPADPALPISTPPELAADLCSDLGPFYTQGMAEDTKALQWRVLDDEEFLDQAGSVLKESSGLLEHELRRFHGKGGFFFFYISSIDQCSHVFWRTEDAARSEHRNRGGADLPKRVSESLPALYEEMDQILARVLEEVDERTTLIVMSDHGFAPFYRMVHLNNWLAETGFLALYDQERLEAKRIAADVDWLRSKAYALGFNGIYLNLFGREPNGLVTENTKAAVLDEIERKLLAWQDPKTGKPVVSRVYRPSEVYSGPYVHHAPDLIVGYARGYRASWGTPLGKLGPAVLEDNHDVWSGDHMMAAEEVPGILLANRPLRKHSPTLIDLPVTILDLFGIARPQGLAGTSILKE
jgi:predicted AlkP superfamily phosphohydrolase/phosphomutase